MGSGTAPPLPPSLLPFRDELSADDTSLAVRFEEENALLPKEALGASEPAKAGPLD